MADRTRARTLLAVLTLVALVVLTLDFRNGDDGPLAAVQRGALAVIGPVQEGFAAVVRPVGDIVGAVGEMGTLREQNAALSSELEDVRGRQPAVVDLQRENAELRALLDMRGRLGFETVAAEVIGRSPGAVGYSVIIDAGAEQGLVPGMAVLDPVGLVGKLTTVVAGHARVELLSSPDARYAVRTAPSGHTGLMQGQGTRPFLMELRDPSVDVEAGEEVVTRSFEGSTIPGGIPVGIVADDDRAGPRYRAVRPHVDFSRLSVVQVVTNAPTVPSELPSQDAVPAPPRPRPRTDGDGVAALRVPGPQPLTPDAA